MRLIICSTFLLLSAWNLAEAQRMTRYFVHLDSEGRITYSFTPGPSAKYNLLLSSETFEPNTDSDMTLPPDTYSIPAREATTTRPTAITRTSQQTQYSSTFNPNFNLPSPRHFTVHYRVRYVTKPPRVQESNGTPIEISQPKMQAPKLILTNATGDFLTEKMKLFKSTEDLNSQIVPVEVSYKLVNGRKMFPEGYRPPNVFVRPIWKHPRLMNVPTPEPALTQTTTESPQIKEFPAADRPTPQRVARPRFLVGHRADLKRILYKLRTRPAPTTTEAPESLRIEPTTVSFPSEVPSFTRSSYRFPLAVERRGPFLVGFRVKRPRPQSILTTEATTVTTPETTTTVNQDSETTVTNVEAERSLESSSESSSAESPREIAKKTMSTSSEEETTTAWEETTTSPVWPESSTIPIEVEAPSTTVEAVTEAVTDTPVADADTTTIEQDTTVELPAAPESFEDAAVETQETTTTTVTPVTATVADPRPIEAVPASEITQEEQDSIDLNEIQNTIDSGFDSTNPNNEITNQVTEIWELKKKMESEFTDEMRAKILDAEQRLEDLFISLRRSRRMRAKMARH